MSDLPKLDGKAHINIIGMAFRLFKDINLVSRIFYNGFSKSYSKFTYRDRIKILCSLNFDIAMKIKRKVRWPSNDHIKVSTCEFVHAVHSTNRVINPKYTCYLGYMDSLKKYKLTEEQIKELCKLSVELAVLAFFYPRSDFSFN